METTGSGTTSGRGSETLGAFSRLCQAWVDAGTELIVGSTRVLARTAEDLADSYCGTRGGELCGVTVRSERGQAAEAGEAKPGEAKAGEAKTRRVGDTLHDTAGACGRLVSRTADQYARVVHEACDVFNEEASSRGPEGGPRSTPPTE